MKDYTDKSFWLATYGEYIPDPALQGDLKVDIAIIGAGFTGLSTAYNLRKQDPGLSVAVLEAEVVGFGASGRNGGFSMTVRLRTCCYETIIQPRKNSRGAPLHGAFSRLCR